MKYDIFITAQECKRIRVTLRGDALAKKGEHQGIYLKTKIYNGRPSWTMPDTVPRYKRKAIWWSSYKFWAIGDYYYTGSYAGAINTCDPISAKCPPTIGPPYVAGLVWAYHYFDGSWKETTNEVIVRCITLNGK